MFKYWKDAGMEVMMPVEPERMLSVMERIVEQNARILDALLLNPAGVRSIQSSPDTQDNSIASADKQTVGEKPA